MRKPLTKDKQAKIVAIICARADNKTIKATGEFIFHCDYSRSQQYVDCLKCHTFKAIGGDSDEKTK